METVKCVICGKEIHDRFFVDPWGNPACSSHERTMCCCCYRFIGRYSTYSPVSKKYGFSLTDGRFVCGICQETSVVSKPQIKTSADFVLKLLKKAGFDVPHGKVTVSLKTQTEMEKDHPGARGVCCYTYTVGKPETTTAKIYILHGLPKMLFEAVLAHEILHFWLHYNGVEDKENEEGFCNIGKALVQNYYVAKHGSDFAAKLREWTNEDSDYYYGIKFLEQKKKLQNMGWKEYVEEILKFKKLS